MLEPYVWYDPHEIIKKLEWHIFWLKWTRNVEIEEIDKKLKYLADKTYWKIG